MQDVSCTYPGGMHSDAASSYSCACQAKPCRLSYFFVWLHYQAVTPVEIISMTVLC